MKKPGPRAIKKPKLKAHVARGGRHQTREEHAQETAQDYVELIAKLIDEIGEARAIDIARKFHVTHVTVGRTLRRLKRLGLVSVEPYRSIFLTTSGRALAEESRHRHETVLQYLIAIGVPPAIAASDAVGMEHHVSQETLSAFSKLLKKKG